MHKCIQSYSPSPFHTPTPRPPSMMYHIARCYSTSSQPNTSPPGTYASANAIAADKMYTPSSNPLLSQIPYMVNLTRVRTRTYTYAHTRTY